METLREFRRRRGWSQKDLADESKVGQDTISGIESGRHEPRPSTLRKLAEALDVEVADFFKELALPKAEAPREAGPGETREPDDENRSVRDIARSEARRQFEHDHQALARAVAAEGIPQPARISDPYDPAVYDGLKRQHPGELAGGLLEAEHNVLWLEHLFALERQENAQLKEENARLNRQLARQQKKAREETQRA